MPVDSVNSANSNAGLYAAGAAVVGGGAGAAVGWNTRPFLKNGEPTDTFVKKIVKNAVNIVPKEVMEPLQAQLKQLENVNSLDELKAVSMDVIRNNFKGLSRSEMQANLYFTNDTLSALGKEGFAEQDIEDVKNLDDVVELFSKNFDKEYAGKTLEDVRAMAQAEVESVSKTAAKNAFEVLWDPQAKKFIKLDLAGEEGLFAELAVNTRKAVVDAANSLKGKAALIYGLGSAAVLGLGTLLCLGGKKAEHIDSKVVEDELQNVENLDNKD